MIRVEDNNLIPYNDWLTGNTTINNGSYTATNFGTVTQIVEYDEDPFGNTGIVWTHNTISPLSRNGFYTATVDVDPNYNYRYSCWVKSNGVTGAYFRLYGWVNGTQSGLTNIMTGTFNANPNFFAQVPYNYSNDQWYLWVGHVRSYDTSGTTNLNESGLYSNNGTKIGGFSDWKFLSNINTTSFRLYIPYNTSGTTVQFVYPRIDKCDGTEPSINTLLKNEGMWRSETTYIKVEDQNLLDYSTWMAGTSGSTTGFNQISTSVINYRELNTDPFGNTNVIWNSVTTASGTSPRAGYTTGFIDVDITKTYRSSVWLKKTNSSLYQTMTHGVRCYNSSSVIQNVIDITSNTTGTDTFYMTAPTGTDFTQDEWELHVGFIYPTTWTGTTDSQYTGRYKPDGTKLSIGSSVLAHGDLKFSGTTTKIYHIVLNIRNSNSSEPIGISSQICYPRIDLVDGTEPSIATLLSNEGMWRSGTTYIKVEDQNLLDYSDWSTDLSGSTSEFSVYWSILDGNTQLNQYRQLDTDPFGNTNYIWVASGVTITGATYGGGYISSGITIDNTKTYRISQWCYRITGDTSNDYYFGFRTYNQSGTITGTTRSDGTYNTNYYTYQNNSANMAGVNGWFMTTGYLMPYTWTGNTTEYQGKIYYNNGLTHTSNAYNYKFNENAKYLASRCFSPYNTTSFAGTKFCYPRIDLCDGTEPSIATLLSNEGMWRSVLQ